MTVNPTEFRAFFLRFVFHFYSVNRRKLFPTSRTGRWCSFSETRGGYKRKYLLSNGITYLKLQIYFLYIQYIDNFEERVINIIQGYKYKYTAKPFHGLK